MVFSFFFNSPTPATSEVNLGLEGEQCEGKGDGCSGSNSHQDSVRIVEASEGPEHEALTD